MQRPAQVPPVRPQFRLVGGTLTGQGRRDEVGEASGCIDGRQCPTRDFPVIVSWRKVALMAAMTAALAACGGGGGGGGTPAPQSSNGNTGAISNGGGGTVLARINACPNGGGGTGVVACVVGAYKGTDPVTKQECTVDIASDYRVTFRNPNHLYQFQEPETPFFYSKVDGGVGIPILLMSFKSTSNGIAFQIKTGFDHGGANITAQYVDLTVEAAETDTTARYEGTCRVPA